MSKRLLLILLTLSSPVLAQSKGELPAKPTPPKAGAKEPQTQRPWGRLRGSLAARIMEKERKLVKLLKPFMPDLALGYAGNEGYLEEKFRRIRKLDLDIAVALLPHLNPKRQDRVRNQVAENAMRILDKVNLENYRPALLTKLDSLKIASRLRVLYLLCPAKTPALKPRLKILLTETPGELVPRLLRCIGRFADPQMAPQIQAFLERPDPKQRAAAGEALAALGLKSSIPLLQQMAEKHESGALFGALLGLLERTQAKTPAEMKQRVAGIVALLKRPDRLTRKEVTDSVRLTLRDDKNALGAERDPLSKALRPLLVHAYPPIQFEAAKALNHLGDKTGIKAVIDRLTRFVKRNRKIPYVYEQRARAYDAFGKRREALKDIRDAIKYSGKDRVSPDLYLFGARLEAGRGNANQVLQFLKNADPTSEELARFRKETPEVEALILKSRQLRRLFQK